MKKEELKAEKQLAVINARLPADHKKITMKDVKEGCFPWEPAYARKS